MSAPIYPEHHSCMRCGGHLTFAERRRSDQTCAACEREKRTAEAQARTLKAITAAVSP